MEKGNAFQMAGLYFQYKEQLVVQFGDPKILSGVHSFPFTGIVSGSTLDHSLTGQMFDSLGMSELTNFKRRSDGSWEFTKEYIGESRRHPYPIFYRFDERSEDGSFWIGRYELQGANIWGEAHAVLAPVSTDFLHLLKLPQVQRFGTSDPLPLLGDQSEDIRHMCEQLASPEHSIVEVWVQVYCLSEKIANSTDSTVDEVFRKAVLVTQVRGVNLLEAMRDLKAEADLG